MRDPRRAGLFTFGPRPRDPVERFWEKVKKTSGCWLWTGTVSRGYGNLRVGSLRDGTRRKVLAPRFSYELVHGPIEDGMFVCHHCDNRRCVRPDHLFLGTNSDNIKDCVAKGKFGARSRWGAENPNYRHGRDCKPRPVHTPESPEPVRREMSLQ